MYVLAFSAFGVMAWGFWQRLPIWRQGKALDRFDRYDERVKRMLAEVFSQVKIYPFGSAIRLLPLCNERRHRYCYAMAPWLPFRQ